MQASLHKAPAAPVAGAIPPLLPTYRPYPFVVAAGQGEYLFDTRGRRYLDFYGGHCVALTGHCHPAVTAAVAEQAEKLIFYSAAARLPVRDAAAQALVEFAGAGMASAFFCNSGAEANESALKLASKLTGRRRFVAFGGGFHGRTLLALSVTDSPALHAGYESLLARCTYLPFGDFGALASADLSEAAAVIVEPIQSMAGVRTAQPDWFAALRAKCTQAGALLIFDEVQTGCGRLGAPSAARLYAVSPDMITCAKGIASGVPMGALLMSKAVAGALREGDLGSTFGGGPLACAAMLATLNVIAQEGLMARAVSMAKRIREGMDGTVVREVRGEGLLLGLNAGPQAAALKSFLLREGILVGGSNDPAVLRLMPPLTIGAEAVDALLGAIGAFPQDAAVQ